MIPNRAFLVAAALAFATPAFAGGGGESIDLKVVHRI